ncbi:LamG-like jellyroll fold domain-containing protein [Nonomuraea dietziae]|uniref:LamG-like jellyroll fold domain-containing protein n=1 Tax=Nonomuraea dietziae TaxID=65515 RepID=UPI0033D4F5A6
MTELEAEGQLAAGLWTFSSLTPWLQARVSDPERRSSTIAVEVEHDPSATGQGSGLIWSATGTTYQPSDYLSTLTVPVGKLQDGWLVRWRVRGVTSSGVAGPWSSWQAGKVDTSKPSVSEHRADPATWGSGLWTFSTTTPTLVTRVSDPDNRSSTIAVEVEHDPSAAGQGSGLIWSETGTTYQPSDYLSTLTVPVGKLQDGWLVRWRVRGVTSNGVAGPWSSWQAGKVDTSKPSVSDFSAGPGTLGADLWTFSSLTPWLQARVSDPDNRSSTVAVEVEHDPSATGQGSGLIWSATGSTYQPSDYLSTLTVPTGKLQDGWLIRWRARGVTSSGVAGPWSSWQAGRIDISKPGVSDLYSSPATLGSGLWSFSSLTPMLQARVSDPDSRSSTVAVEVEHDPSAAAQGSGLIWSATGTTFRPSGYLGEVTVPSGKLQDGWLIRWRIRGVTSSGVKGPWSIWQTGKVDTSKPGVSDLYVSPATLGSGLWSFSSLTPMLQARVSDPDSRSSTVAVEVEHDPSAAAQGSGLIWSATGTTFRPSGYLGELTVPSGKLQDGWLIRWRIRGVTSNSVKGPWSVWQSAKLEVNKPAGTTPGMLPSTQHSGQWTVSALTPWLFAKVTEPGGASSYLGVEVEHDPSAIAQGSGMIWAGKGSTAYASGSNAWTQVPAGKLSDGWFIRWRVRGVTTTGTNGTWSEWQSARVDMTKPSVAAAGMTPGTAEPGLWTVSSRTPWVYAKVTDPESRASFLGIEVEHAPSAGGQGSGLIWAGTGTTSYNSGTNAWAQVPSAKLSDGWLVRWRVRGQTTTGVNGPWSDWQLAKVDLKRPSAEGLGMDPAVRGTASWTAATLTPWLYAKVTDPENRASYLGVEVEHDPSVSGQGSGLIYAATATTSYASGSNAWMVIPADKLMDGWSIRWRVRGVTTSGITGAWSDWQFARVSALPFETFSPADNTQVGTLTPTLSAHAHPLSEAPVTYWFQVCAGTKPNWTWCESSPNWVKSGAWTVPEKKLKWGETYSWFAKAATSTTTVTSSWRTFTPTPEQGSINSLLASSSGGQEFDHSSGNYTHAETDISVAAVGLPLSVSRTYNSLDPRTDGAFGAGWSTRWDMRVTPEPQTSTLLVTYPAGEQLRFAAKGDGTYASPPGTYATLVKLPEGGWRLMDKSSTSYWFDTAGQLTKITDARNRGQQLAYGTDGKLSKVTATGDRSLTFIWTGNHVTSVSTDPVNGAAITWTYAYEDDKLVKACPPIPDGACTTYTYGDASRYRSLVTDAAPQGYWRLNETTPATGTKIANSAGWNIATEDAKLTGATADLTVGVTGALSGSTDPAMRFKGTATSTYVSLPQATVSGQGNTLAVEAWFKTTGSGTVLGYQNSATNTPSAFTPVVYVGTDGKLRGQFYNGKSAPITSSTVVNDGAWHHVVLSGAEDTQTLYLDGQAVGTLAGTITHVDQWETRIGSGFGSSAWPATTGSTAPFPFAGDIDEVAVYGKPLGLALVRAHYAARLAQPQMTKVVRPSGKVWAENSFAADGGRLRAANAMR